MAGLNKVQLIGNLGKDVELKYTPSGVAVANFSLATTESYTDKQGERHENVEWHNIVVWRKLAEVCGKYLHKGKQIYVEGKIQTRKWQDRDGIDRWATEIVMDKMLMLGKANDGAANGSTSTPAANGSTSTPAANGSTSTPQMEEPPAFNPDDEIPF